MFSFRGKASGLLSGRFALSGFDFTSPLRQFSFWFSFSGINPRLDKLS
ncbi:hypothetical protein HMPREF0573_10545 [Mobiluncus curtisii ATCC 43063]|uniref:Uncharacterized protein n=1 Tax=Mobiluncus curtisii (strain ATCC 43063 / DSM 2711 / V125) TaxID=548479 RepID=D6ZJG5_MOBCV|nr:hypothetical protein HMPREF0573_10545 [Mobiluncus curtisii ATCC 43063]